ncbi:MAG: TMEM165/GDT1 family protein [Spirochaetales bacterium]|nr:TMEM165/GDT1 family protein [Spirochaetales bacterium]RKX81690.1 MAG: hypothetical protein DRP57_11555 [Spirochaetota bacterium]
MFINLKVIVSTFFMIFLAELGDKTQITTFAFASRSKSSLSVFIGASSALVLTSLIAVLIGEVVGKYVPAKVMKIVAGVIFLIFGGVTLFEALKA